MRKICQYCGNEFEGTERKKYCKGPHYIICPICGSSRLAKYKSQLEKPTACSYACRVKATQKTSMERYGCIAPGNNPEARKKAKATCMKNHGVPYALQSKEIRDKGIETNLKKYGVTNPGANLEIIQKRMKTNREKYGDVMPFNRPEAYEKQRESLKKHYGVTTGFLTEKCISSRRETTSELNKSIEQRLHVLSDYTTTLEYPINTKLYDIYIQETNTVVEINPTFTHTCIPQYNMPGYNKYYHRDKTQLARDNGYKCVNIWDWDDLGIVTNQLTARKSIDVNELSLVVLDKQYYDEFFINNHANGTHRGIKLCIGLTKNNTIYQAIALGKPTHQCNYDVQIYRMATKAGYVIPGGYDRLSSWLSLFEFSSIIAYADRSKTDGSEFIEIGMKQIRVTPPQKIWSKGNQYINNSMRGKMFKSEQELLDDGWLPVYDCGQIVFEYRAQ